MKEFGGLKILKVLQVPYLIVTLATLLTLLYASYRDLKYRDIPELTWVPAAIVALAVNLVLGEYNDILYLVFSLMPAVLILIMSLFGMIGGADFLAILLVGIAHPKFKFLPISLLTLLYSLIIPLLLVIYYTIYNLLMFRAILSSIKCGRGRRLYLILFGKPIRVRDFLKMKFTYLLTVPRGGGFDCRASFSLEEEEGTIRELILKYVNDGVLTLDDYVWVTPALPHVFFILIGYVLSILTAEQLPQLLITYIFH